MGCGMSSEAGSGHRSNTYPSSSTMDGPNSSRWRAMNRQRRNDDIDAELLLSAQRARNSVKILLLGAGESGKSTILKQMKLIHGLGFTEFERLQYAKIIWSDAVQSMRILITQAAMMGITLDSDNPANSVLTMANSLIMATSPLHVYEEDYDEGEGIGIQGSSPGSSLVPSRRNFLEDYVLKYDRGRHPTGVPVAEWNGSLEEVENERSTLVTDSPAGSSQFEADTSILEKQELIKDTNASSSGSDAVLTVIESLTPPTKLTKLVVAHALNDLWTKDRGIRQVFNRSNEFQLEVSAEHYFDNIFTFAGHHYKATDQDILNGRIKTTGITETLFNIGELNFRMFDVGGQRSERRKWIHCFNDVNAILFVVAASEYDEVLFEDENVNRMHEAMVLFESICNSKFFTQTPIILFLNKTDVLGKKLQRSCITDYYPEYKGDVNSSKQVCHFFKDILIGLNKTPSKPIYVHYTCATDTKSMKFVMGAVTDMIIQQNLRQTGII